MAYLVEFGVGEPRYIPGIRFPGEDSRFFFDHAPKDEFDIVRYDPTIVPRRAEMISSHKTIADFVPIHGRMTVAPEVRDLIEELEPGVHQFIPVEIVRGRGKKPIYRIDGRILDHPYYLFNVQIQVDPVWIERSEVQVHSFPGRPDYVYMKRLPTRGKIVLHRDMVAGHHAWSGRYQLRGNLFFSDTLVHEIQKRRFRKLEMMHLEEQ